MAVSAVHATLVVGTPAEFVEALAQESRRTSLAACVLIVAGGEVHALQNQPWGWS
jgi:hypothetical protein